MIFTLNNLKQFLRSMKNHKLNQINIQGKNLDIIINKTNIIDTKYYNNQTVIKEKKIKNNNHNIYENKLKSNYNNAINNNMIENDKSTIYSTIISPMVGTFYRSPGPNEPAFIEKNDKVQNKQIVCIIEAMKLMNEIEAEVSGEIVEILVNDGDIVDCGQALMRVK
uniref:Biotin carboxyl carrier protein of acetyl-CoA carboxylase n=1 Tax=Acrosorium ciliolatum TaxID=1550622 RepID=A0A1Z1M1S2_9FLOR|nr:acetyl-CoA carboxylase biotin carboxyl carrier protein [Acrosorium ciliolatum]ARW60028.1 acetyl-CoA carboxylase biotin carboxyl carrier protein [Acrosorium ciliolatum]